MIKLREPRKSKLLAWIGIFVIGCAAGFGIQFIPLDKTDSHLPYSTPVLERLGYTVAYDGRTKTALWVYEELTRDSITGNVKRDGMRFSQDPNIPTLIQPNLKDYRGSGFDRGHLAPFADHKSSEVAAKETFYLSNISPQNPQFNQGYWAKLERHVRDLTNEFDRVRVVTGPLFLPTGLPGQRFVNYRVIGKNDVAVATHFFKVVTAEKGQTERQWAYILPNKEIPRETPLSDFEVSLSKVEKEAGIILNQGR